jgi:hypothetical protein
VTARDLVRETPARAKGRPVVMGDPDYDLDFGKRVASGTRLDRYRAEHGSPPRSADMRDERFDAMRGVKEEVEAIAPLIRKVTGVEPTVLTGARASERAFKELVGPAVLVLSTHGIFLAIPPDPSRQDLGPVPADKMDLVIRVPPGSRVWVNDVEKTKRVLRYSMEPGQTYEGTIRVRFADGKEETRALVQEAGRRVVVTFGPRALPAHLENPLLRCGLILAGANRRHLLPPEAADDGILTGLEIVGTDLRGTELVVLSACETGVGDLRNAEGVVGLRQAFQLAGARQVVASLWKVPDGETKDLMVKFWSDLGDTGDPAATLTTAQRALIRKWRSAGEPTHPYFWAAFGVTGAPR